jgi:hypothetical protein
VGLAAGGVTLIAGVRVRASTVCRLRTAWHQAAIAQVVLAAQATLGLPHPQDDLHLPGPLDHARRNHGR